MRKVCSVHVARDDFLRYMLFIFDDDYEKAWKEIMKKPHAYTMFAYGFYMYGEQAEE